MISFVQKIQTSNSIQESTSAKLTVNLDAGETVTCTFKNREQQGSILIKKITTTSQGTGVYLRR